SGRVLEISQHGTAFCSANGCISVNADCVRFKEETMVNLMNMAGDIHRYAQQVAGDGASYFVIFQTLRDMADPDSPYNAMHLSMFTVEIDGLFRNVTRYQFKAQAIASEATVEHKGDDHLHPYAARTTADMASVKECFNKLVATCGSAATILDGMVTTWGDILDNLIHLKSAVTGDPHVGAGAMLEVINQDEVKQKWNTLAERVEEFLTLARAIGQEQANV
ncbi:hypothetical protein K523DRAFT_399555, partial [Schizophyllum commune Tattone D]